MLCRKRYIVVLTVIAALTWTSLAYSATTIYWGYNNMTSSNPPSGTCSGNGSGVACSGFNYWDRSQIDINSGSAVITFGFQNCAGCTLLGPDVQYGGVYTLLRTDWNAAHPSFPVNAYNRTTSAHNPCCGSYAYLQGRAIIF